VTEPLPPEDPRDALIREQAALLTVGYWLIATNVRNPGMTSLAGTEDVTVDGTSPRPI
jgi:hypothetical protein